MSDTQVGYLEEELRKALDVQCMGTGDDGSGCGFTGGTSGQACPKCNGMLMSKAARDEAERMYLVDLLQRCLPIVEQDALMADALRRHSPLPAEEQAKHNETPWDSERLLPVLYDVLKVTPRVGACEECLEGDSPVVFWLSFVDEEKPAGQRFQGVVMTKAKDFMSAVQKAWKLGVNPGGQVAGGEFPAGEKGPLDVLLSEAQLREAGYID